MTAFDVVLLTADKYLDTQEQGPLVHNVRLEDGLVAEALENEGLRVTIKSWSDSEFDWSSSRYILVRTPWDYFERSNEFMAWFDSTSKKTEFINSPTMIRWNFDKNYLKDLQQKGIAIPKTYFISKGSRLTLKMALQKSAEAFGRTCDTWVLKPCVAAGAYNTFKFKSSEIKTYEERFKKLISEADFMLQEFQESIVDQGEVSLVFFGTIFSHAVIKRAKPGDFRVQDDYGGTVALYEASQKEIDFSLQVLLACDELPIYSRVDILMENDGNLALAELEIFEPELWFRFQPKSAEILAQTIKKAYFK